VHKRIISAVKRVASISDRMAYIILRGHWCCVIVLQVHARSEDKTDDVKDSFYEQLVTTFLLALSVLSSFWVSSVVFFCFPGTIPCDAVRSYVRAEFLIPKASKSNGFCRLRCLLRAALL
jgi:hypothetical protein